MTRRHSFLLLCFSLTSLICADADAGCCDWLFGRTNSPYVVGYAPQVVYRSGLNAPFVANPYAAGYAPVAVAGTAAPANAAYQAQMQSYDNPSVYTGRPVIVNQGLSQTSYSLPITGAAAPLGFGSQSYGANYGGASSFGRAATAVPLAGRYRGPPATTSNPIYGTGNVYPTTSQAGVYQSNYPSVASPGVPTVTSVPTGLPPSALPATPVAPLYTAAPEPRVGGLARFFGSSLGTNYRSSYYRAPVTYYRPVTSVDPVSGTTVTVQQPCTSYVQQLQRTPYSSLQPGFIAPTVTPMNGPGCQTAYPGYAAAPIAADPTTISPFGSQPLSSGVGQVGGYTSSNDRLVVPIPSTQQPGYYQQPSGPLNTSPLTGSAPDDRAPVDQPRLESARPSADADWWRRDNSADDVNQYDDPPLKESTEPSSYLKQIDLGDRTVLNEGRDSQSVQQVQAFSDVRPIAAPEGFENPFDRRTAQPITPVNRRDLVAPPLPPARVTPEDERASYSASLQVSTPVREATLRKSPITMGPPAASPQLPKRDNTWYSSK